MDDNFIALMDISNEELQAAEIFRQLSGERNYPAMLEDTVNFVGASVSTYRKAQEGIMRTSESAEMPKVTELAGSVPTGFWLDEAALDGEFDEDNDPDDFYSNIRSVWGAQLPSADFETFFEKASPGKELMLWRDANAKRNHKPMRLWDFVADTMSRIRETHPGATLEDVKFEMNADGSADMVIKANEPIAPTAIQTRAERNAQTC